jgi:glucose dehydrogenase
MIRLPSFHVSLAVATLGTLLAAESGAQQVTPLRIVRAADEPSNWLTYSGTYSSQRHTTLRQITPQNVRNLEQQWVLQGAFG